MNAKIYMNEKIMTALLSGKKEFETERNGKKYKYTIVKEHIGKINLSTGSIIASDPFMYVYNPFTRKVQEGLYDVYLYVAKSENNDMRVAFSVIEFENKIPSRFELALTKSDDIKKLDDEGYYGYFVDTGYGSFMDEETAKKLSDVNQNGEYEVDDIGDETEDVLRENYVNTYSKCNYFIGNEDKNIIIFSSGYGDGSYPCYYGFDEKDSVCVLMNDLMVFDEDTEVID